MRQGTYLNVILTVNAVLLAGALWTQIAGGPVLTQSASAQSPGGRDSGKGIPDAGAQREKMIEALRDLKASVDASRKLLESGKLRVQVTNLDEIDLKAADGQ
jgi:hypothetical protein